MRQSACPPHAAQVVSPFATERRTSLLMRFDYPLQDGKSLVSHHGHRIRKELIDFQEHNALNGSDLGPAQHQGGACGAYA